MRFAPEISGMPLLKGRAGSRLIVARAVMGVVLYNANTWSNLRVESAILLIRPACIPHVTTDEAVQVSEALHGKGGASEC